MITAIIAAGGRGTRMGADINKVYLNLDGMEIIARTVLAFEENQEIDEIIVVTGEADILRFEEIQRHYGFCKISAVVVGGGTRAESVYNGLKKSKGDIILIHDGARALISQEEINNVITDCKKYKAAALGVKCKDTLKASTDGFITATLDRETTYQIQTPQAFMREIILSAHQNACDNLTTDDCGMVEAMGVKIKITEGSYDNIKLTTPSDMAIGSEILKRRSKV